MLMQHTLILKHCYLDQTKIKHFDMLVINNNIDIEFLNNKEVNNHLKKNGNNIYEKNILKDIKNKNPINLKDKIKVEKKLDINLDLLLKENYLDNEHSINNSNSLEETLNN